MNNLQSAKDIFKTGDFTCVLCKDGVVYTDKKQGIAPLVEWLSIGLDMKGFSAADKIVGKAAALLFVLGGVNEVYGAVMTKTASEILSGYGINAEYGTLTENITNRSGTGLCPMEQAVTHIDDPAEAFGAIKSKLKSLAEKKEV